MHKLKVGLREIRVYKLRDRYLAAWYEGTPRRRHRKSFSSEELAVRWANVQLWNIPEGKSMRDSIVKTHLYLMRCGEYTKIGIASDVPKRARTLQAACPYNVEILASFRLPKPHSTERQLHRRFALFRHHREWFQLSFQDIEDLKNELSRIAIETCLVSADRFR